MRRFSNTRQTLYTLPFLVSFRRMSGTQAFIPMHAFDVSRMHQHQYNRLFSENSVTNTITLEPDSSIKTSKISNDLFRLEVQQDKDDSSFTQVKNGPLHHSSETMTDFPSTMTIYNLLKSDMSAKYSHKPIVVGHRGALYKSLENTRHSVKLAVEHGAEQVEIDVFLLKCGELVVFHGTGSDAKPGGLLEYCGVEGSILDLSYEEVKELKFNPHFAEFGCGPKVIEELDTECYIPTLFEVLSDAKEIGTTIKIELKGPNTAEPVLKLVESLDMVDNVHYSSFDHSQIKRIRELRPDRLPDGSHRYKTGALFNECPTDFIQKAKEVDASEVHLKYSTCTTERVKMIHEAGMDSMIWMRGPRGMLHDSKYLFHNVGHEDEEMYRAIMSTGVKGMIVNRPDILSRLLCSQ